MIFQGFRSWAKVEIRGPHYFTNLLVSGIGLALRLAHAYRFTPSKYIIIVFCDDNSLIHGHIQAVPSSVPYFWRFEKQ
jgi:hypothetical protein